MPLMKIIKIAFILGNLNFIGWLGIAILAIREKEKTAARRSLLLACLSALPFWMTPILPDTIQSVWSVGLLALTGIFIGILFFPVRAKSNFVQNIPDSHRFDERETMFSRAELRPGSAEYDHYYRNYPGHKAPDDRFRQKPGLLSPDARFFHLEYFSEARYLFDQIAAQRDGVDGPVTPQKRSISPENATQTLKIKILQSGAHSVGITRLKPYHLYSVSGQGDRYGLPIDLSHRFAITFTVEMDFDAVAHAPKAPAVTESARQYLNSGQIALEIAREIRSWGYAARAHIDGNYLLICPLVARDAGLGEIGRMGLLLTPKLGPRVRIAVVTTDLPLIKDTYTPDPSVEDFCRKCKKCADNCPANAIPKGKRETLHGLQRWKINDVHCYTYWCAVGTDCARCMRVCPYSHPNTFFHNVIRFGIRHFPVFRRFALQMDNLLYGKYPKPRSF
ncbi:MAG TPA: 4Fe-4S dicluster domain-containing protein [Candidatus Marinimicrobia bacterium]|nr:4Fe-4S dicluster domain-containing protein [Candidatus Neomarinimicrobiota bacterium]